MMYRKGAEQFTLCDDDDQEVNEELKWQKSQSIVRGKSANIT